MQIDPGSSVGILKLNVGKDSVVAEIVTLRQEKVELKGSTESQYLYTILEFPFRELPAMDPAAVKRVVFTALAPEGSSSADTLSPGQVVDLPPTPGAAVLGPPSGNNQLIGKTADELTLLLGPPTTTVDVNGQTIYVYSGLNLRVVVKAGTVVNVQ